MLGGKGKKSGPGGSTTSKTPRTWVRRGIAKQQFLPTIKSFGDAKHNLKMVFMTRKDRVYDWIEFDDIKYLEQVHQAIFAKPNSFMPRSDRDKENQVMDLLDILNAYIRDVLAPMLAASPPSLLIGDPEIMRFIALQQRAIAATILSSRSKPTKVKNKLEQYYAAIEAIKLLVHPDFTKALRRTLPQPLDPKAPIKATGIHTPLDMLTGLAASPTDGAVTMTSLDLTGLFGTNPEAQLMSRLGKQAAKRSASLAVRSTDEKQRVIGAAVNFSTSSNAQTLLSMVRESVTRLSEKTDTHTVGKVSQYAPYDTVRERIVDTHNTTKVALYKDKYETKQIGADALDIIDKHTKARVISMQGQNNTQGQLERAVIVVPAESNKELGTQALVVDQLMTTAKACGAVSVNVASRDADGAIVLDNVLKHAFNALHANLVPTFDNDTWNALVQHAADPSTVAYTSKDPNDLQAYAGRYRSKQFAEFLISIRPSDSNKKTYEQIYNEFTQLQRVLGYRKIYPLLRRPGKTT